MKQVVPWAGLLSPIGPYYPRQAMAVHRIGWKPCCAFICCRTGLSSVIRGMEESLYEITSLRQFFQLSLTQGSIPEGKTVMNFRHLLQ